MTSAYGDEVEDLRFFGLPVAVDAADALLQPGRVERDVEVHQPVAVGLQVDALAGGVGGEQDAHRLLGRVLGELRADVLAVLGLGRALDHGQRARRTRAGVSTRVSQSTVWAYSVNTTTRSLDQVLPSGRHTASRKPIRRVEPGVGAALVAQPPLHERFKLAGLGGDQRVGALGLAQPLGLVLLPQALFLVGLALAEDVVVVVLRQATPSLRGQVVAQRHAERERAGQEPLLQQHRHDVAAGLGAVLLRALGDDVVEQRERSPARRPMG